ncbi:hypothetical protein Tco_1118062 [Tanacetum coccineum]
MLSPGSYAQWKSRFMRYVDTKPNRELLKKTIYEGPYIMTEITHPKTPKDGDRPRLQEAVHLILNGIGNDIYSTMDACTNAKEMWIEIE